jgi:hypothetical protein
MWLCQHPLLLDEPVTGDHCNEEEMNKGEILS